MTTIRDTIRSAYRICGSLRSGADLDEKRATVGLEKFQDMVLSWFQSGLFGRFTDLIKSEDYEICEWDRVLIPDATVTVTWPSQIYDPSRSGNYRQPYNWVPAMVVNQATGAHDLRLYNAATGAWTPFNAFALGDTVPFGPFVDKWLKACLAMELVDELGLPLTKKLQRDAVVGKIQIASQYDQQRRSGQTEYF